MANNYKQAKLQKNDSTCEVKRIVLETVHERICCGKSYYDYLNDIRSEDLNDTCDYCTAFMLA